jgi:hypothetical protein
MRYEGSSVARCRARCERSPLCPEGGLRIAAMSSSRAERMRISSASSDEPREEYHEHIQVRKELIMPKREMGLSASAAYDVVLFLPAKGRLLGGQAETRTPGEMVSPHHAVQVFNINASVSQSNYASRFIT